MKTFTVLLTAGALLGLMLYHLSGAETLTFTITPERGKIIRDVGSEVVLRFDVKGRDSKLRRRAPLNIALVLDRSGSMAGAKLEKARQAAAMVVDRLTSRDTLSVIVYDDVAEVLVPARKVTDPGAIKRKISQITDRGSTALYAGVRLGADQLREHLNSEKINRVILLSDGIANVGPSRPQDLARLGRDLRREGLPVTTIGLGDDYNEDLMVALAESSAANYYYVKDTEKLPGIFAEELGRLQNILARNIRIIIELPEGLEPVEVIGEPEIRFQNRTAEVTVPELYGAQQRSILVRARLTSPGSKDRLEVARAQIVYRDEEAGTEKKQSGNASIELTGDVKVSEASLNGEVARELALVSNRVDRERALELVDKGDVVGASSLMKSRAAQNAALPAAYRSERLKEETEKISKDADFLDSNGGFDRAGRKAFQYDNYEQKKQRK
ncbi:MAG: VWA domain-containing protein [Verrucomicrobiae bacterium]|nr:VWA domain-containing protein [Verrucomicrobiae bacterium]